MHGRALGGVQRVQGPQEDDEEAGSATRDILERPEGGGERSEVWELWGKTTNGIIEILILGLASDTTYPP